RGRDGLETSRTHRSTPRSSTYRTPPADWFQDPRGDAQDLQAVRPGQGNIKPAIGRCVAINSHHHSCNELSHSVNVTGSTGYPEAERLTVGSSRPKSKATGSGSRPCDRVARPARQGQSYTASSPILSG